MSTPFTRRRFIGVAAAAVTVPLISSCAPGGGGGGASGGGELKFWDMPWGTDAYTKLAQRITADYVPPAGLLRASYQQVQWDGFFQTFSSAIASNTGPAVSSGSSFQAFQFAEQGKIAYADTLLENMKKSGTFDDFLPGIAETMKTANGYVAVPWNLDPDTWWYNKALLDEAGAKIPTNWDELFDAGLALKKIGASAWATAGGAGASVGGQALLSMLINNGGGAFDADKRPAAVTERNIEAIDFVIEMVREGMVDKGALAFKQEDLDNQWNTGKAAIGIHTPGLKARATAVAADLHVLEPIAGPHGDKGSLIAVNNLMMYTNTPSQEASEAFLEYYLSALQKELWKANVGSGLPVFKSVTQADYFTNDPENVVMVEKVVPACKSWAAVGNELFGGLAAFDGGQALAQFTQAVLQGKQDAKTLLTKLQQDMEAVIK